MSHDPPPSHTQPPTHPRHPLSLSLYTHYQQSEQKTNVTESRQHFKLNSDFLSLFEQIEQHRLSGNVRPGAHRSSLKGAMCGFGKNTLQSEETN